MTDLQTPRSDTPDMADHRAGSKRRKRWIGAGVVVTVLGVLAFLTYWFVFRDDPAASVDTEEAERARTEALEEAAGESGTLPAAPTEATEPAEPAEPAEADPTEPTGAEPTEPTGAEGATGNEDAAADLDGVWAVDTSIGTFDPACLTEVCGATFAGFRINEELASIGAKTVVGRTPGVNGTMEIDGTTIVSADLVVDMTQLITDDPGRTNAIRRQAIETSQFPEARFVLTQPIELGQLPAEGEPVNVDATGELTIHGVTRTETIPLTAELRGDVIVVFGQLGPILLADYDIEQPTAAVVLSVEDNAIMELQLFFTLS